MAPRGKNYKEAAAKIDADKEYSPKEAIALVKETSYTKFDATVELHLRLGVDPRHAEQQVRDVALLPHGLGKEMRVLVFAQGDGARLAREAGATEVADDDTVLKKIEDGWLDFDVAISTPEMMGAVGKLGRVLGPRGLMPNPKAGTVVPEQDLPRAIDEAQAGRVEFRLDKTANIHVPIGKVSFEEDAIYDNLAVLMDGVKKARPAAAKGIYIKRVVLTSTMGPSVKIDPLQAMDMVLKN